MSLKFWVKLYNSEQLDFVVVNQWNNQLQQNLLKQQFVQTYPNVTLEEKDELRQNLLKQQFVRTYPNVTLEEKDEFLRIKKDEYVRRRETIQSFCRNSSELSRQIINSSLVYDGQDEVSYCMIPKEAWSKTTSLVVVRHPLARLASLYQDKFVKLADSEFWGPLVRNIISMFRQKIEPREIIKPENENIPTPEEMIRVEEINEDTLFFLITSGLEGRLNPGIRKNPSTHDERTFWSQVSNETISELLHPYQQDFLMFNYSARAYLENLNIPFSSALIHL